MIHAQDKKQLLKQERHAVGGENYLEDVEADSSIHLGDRVSIPMNQGGSKPSPIWPMMAGIGVAACSVLAYNNLDKAPKPVPAEPPQAVVEPDNDTQYQLRIVPDDNVPADSGSFPGSGSGSIPIPR